MEPRVVLLLLAVSATLAAPQFLDSNTQAFGQQDIQQGLQQGLQQGPSQDVQQDLQDRPATPAPSGADDGDLEYMLDDAGEGGWEALKGTVDIPLDDVQWSLGQLPPSMRRALRLVLFDNYRANFT